MSSLDAKAETEKSYYCVDFKYLARLLRKPLTKP